MRKSPSPALCAFLLATATAGQSSTERDRPVPHPACGDQTAIVFPGSTWAVIDSIEEAGWDRNKLAAARAFADSIGSHAVVIVDRGRIVAEWGPTDEVLYVASMRKSVLSALIGIAVHEGRISLDATLADLDITDTPPELSPVERSATVRQLLQSRSGISHPAAAAPSGPVPQRGEHAPGTFWFYNNWDFNVLGTIYERAVGKGIYDQIEQRLAVPLQMEGFTREDGQYQLEPRSMHPAYHFNMSSRDLARFGLLYLACGRWKDRQIVPREWVEESLRPWSEVTNPWTPEGTLGYGYMWYVDHPFHGFSARGGTAQRVAVLPEQGLVIVHRVNDQHPVYDGPLDELIRRIIAARTG